MSLGLLSRKARLFVVTQTLNSLHSKEEEAQVSVNLVMLPRSVLHCSGPEQAL